MITIQLHSGSILIGIFVGLLLGMATAFWACKDDFSRGWDCGYKCGRERKEGVSDERNIV